MSVFSATKTARGRKTTGTGRGAETGAHAGRATWISRGAGWTANSRRTVSARAITLEVTAPSTGLGRVFQNGAKGPLVDPRFEFSDQTAAKITREFCDQPAALSPAVTVPTPARKSTERTTQAGRSFGTRQATRGTTTEIVAALPPFRERLRGADRLHICDIRRSLEGDTGTEPHAERWAFKAIDPLNAGQQIGPTLGT